MRKQGRSPIIGVLTMYDSQGQAYVDDVRGEPHVVDASRVRLATATERSDAGFGEAD